MPFARNQWYVIAYSAEIGEELMARTVCGEPIVLYRTSDGRVTGLADRCVHRRYPLSHSNRVGDQIVCGYHGFTYDAQGTCVAVPGQTRIPRTARVPAYPIVEQDSLIWVWIGDGPADPAAIPRAPWLDRNVTPAKTATMHPAAIAANRPQSRCAARWFESCCAWETPCFPAAARPWPATFDAFQETWNELFA